MAKPDLELPFNQFSQRAVDQLRAGRIDPEPLVRLIERSRHIAQGAATAMLLLSNSQAARASDDGVSLSITAEEDLLNLAREACSMLSDEIWRVAQWAEGQATRVES
ncbi:hypothetical protein [Burkholderia cenocepacia]|uniref:Uncharacterized protein n=1 Tax=Burkholderia cenocepacia TaxID=95486 RepID=A0AAD0NAH4_9BURK|nr:hypothetical protein [Burkholderia cenocepacia]AWG30952.1 hypothetical protein B9Z07_18970 [Burkholderia cenocepacia]PRE38610.1 hypothetical protein C6P63_01620 [Burkholderia cenocepacia]HEM7885793.1 hypothetical protein [Burkholderia cenocepacia]